VRLGGAAWLCGLGRAERRACAICFGGRLFDAMDAQIFALVLPTLIVAFGLTRFQAGLIGSVHGLGSAASAMVAGIAADRLGRLRVLRWALLAAALATMLLGLATSPAMFAGLRACQGLAYGAEIVAGSTLVTEMVRDGWRGRAAAAVHSGHALGYMVALVAVMVLGTGVSGNWRWLFALGLLPAVYALMLPRIAPESTLFLAEQSRDPARVVRLADLFGPQMRRNTLVTGLIGVGIYGASQVMAIWLPMLLHIRAQRHGGLPVAYLALNLAGAAIGPWVYGPMSDRWGRRRLFLAFTAMQIVLLSLFLGLVRFDWQAGLLAAGFAIGFAQGGLGSGIQPIVAELYPTPIRGRAMGINTSLIRASAALGPTLVGALTASLSLGRAMALIAIGAYVLALIGIALIPETLGTRLKDL
jgi:MFS family permease